MLTYDEVIWGFRYCLGRDPESEDVILSHRNFRNWGDLRNALLRCPEFVNSNNNYVGMVDHWVITPVLNNEYLMWVDLGDRYVSRACILDDYEPYETRFVRDHLEPGDIFLDVGANIGWYTLLASKIVGSHGSVYAIEPRPGTYDRLRETISLNKLQDKVKLYKLAASDHAGVAFISWASQTDNPGGSFVSAYELGGDMITRPIELAPIDSLKIPKVDFIKMDVEGSEYQVVIGAIGLIRESRPIIMSEVNPTALKNISGKSPTEYIKIFLDLDYKIFIIDSVHGGKEICEFPTWWERDLMNVGMIPKERV